MKTGGYQIIDFQGAQVASNTGANIPGIYERIESLATDKALLISGIVFNGEVIPDKYISKADIKLLSNVYWIPVKETRTTSSIVTTYIKVESDDDISVTTETFSGGGGGGGDALPIVNIGRVNAQGQRTLTEGQLMALNEVPDNTPFILRGVFVTGTVAGWESDPDFHSFDSLALLAIKSTSDNYIDLGTNYVGANEVGGVIEDVFEVAGVYKAKLYIMDGILYTQKSVIPQ